MMRGALRLQWASVSWLVCEAAFGLALAATSGGLALLSFGWDSAIEITSALVVLRRLGIEARGQPASVVIRSDRRASWLAGSALLALSAYVVAEALIRVIGTSVHPPQGPDIPGIVFAATTLVVMAWIVKRKYACAAAIGSRALKADASCGKVCVMMSAALLLGLGVQALFGWWWADVAAAVVIAYYALKEGLEALRDARDCVECPGCAMICRVPQCACECC